MMLSNSILMGVPRVTPVLVGGGGGILRDGGGRLLLAFSCHLGHATSLQAEVRALLFGVKLCVQRGFGRLDVELDFTRFSPHSTW